MPRTPATSAAKWVVKLATRWTIKVMWALWVSVERAAAGERYPSRGLLSRDWPSGPPERLCQRVVRAWTCVCRAGFLDLRGLPEHEAGVLLRDPLPTGLVSNPGDPHG